MKREVIQDFLNLPGIAGVALMDGRSRPYFCGIDQALNFQQKEALAQGILQVVETIPDSFDVFEFQFAEHQVRLYRLDRGMVLLVLTHQRLICADYLSMITQLKTVLKEDIPNAIATFRLLAGNVTLTGLHYRRQSAAPATTPNTTTALQSEKPQATRATPLADIPLVEETPLANSSPAPFLPEPSPPNAKTSDAATLFEAIAALNHLSQFTTQYLGTHVIANYWKATRPSSDWLATVQVDRTAQFTVTGAPPQATTTPLTAPERQWLQEWVTAFVKRCSQVMRDFPAIVEQKALNNQQKALLLKPFNDSTKG
ncbi:hypothetical protein H6F76_08250 [Leptolyngbya sp. FACHB-321]|uniref:hypothetical protein n=1 Tax=Leptolyngbya sp. FACHB-321 TaxID=2692807 RepID=UPI0016850E7C|nr:hypothetical protein [Leptolyngbya sp. FACHB-321]MBD2035018.1 hypothetical protein [Leptolyngbya sp. FACHB-321]